MPSQVYPGIRGDGSVAASYVVTEYTIATGAITLAGGSERITCDTESDAATDDLATINGGISGQLLFIRAADGARTVVCKDGTGNLQLAGSDFSLDNAQDTIMLWFDGTNWLEISRSNNGA